MVRKRLATVLTFNNGVLFRTRNFEPDYRYTANFVDAWSVDEIVLLDISRPGEGDRENFLDVLRDFARTCCVPLSVGGWVRSLDDFHLYLGMGGDKIVVNTLALEDPSFIEKAARRYGSQCVVVSMDVRQDEGGGYSVWTRQGTHPLGMDPASCARMVCDAGAGEILVQSIDRDGTLEGYDLELAALVAEVADIPVLACSGAGSWRHFLEAFTRTNVSAVCTTNIYHFTDPALRSAKRFLRNAGISIRG